MYQKQLILKLFLQVLETLFHQVVSISPVLTQVESQVRLAEEKIGEYKLKHDLEDKLKDKKSKQILTMSERLEAAESWCLGESDRIDALDNAKILKLRKKSKRVKLNVGGIKHEVMWKMLRQAPTSRLGKLEAATTHKDIIKLCADYSIQENEYFFDRHPRSFNSILNFYRTGRLHIQDGICPLAFCEDLNYWQLDELCVENCCAFAYGNKKEAVLEEMAVASSHLKKDKEDEFGEGFFSIIQQKLWDTMEKSDSSLLAKSVSLLSLVFVIISTAGMCLSTIQAMQGMDEDGNATENQTLEILEMFSVIWFTVEYFLRLIGSPKKWSFLKNTMNLLDIAAVLPFYVPLFITLMEPNLNTGTDEITNQRIQEAEANPWEIPATTNLKEHEDGPIEVRSGGSLEDILQIFKIFKLLRIAKLARHSTGIQAIAVTLINSYKELTLLVMLICIAGLLFSSFVYFIEVGEEGTSFYSIPNAFWWSVITMTTVGYGDMMPTTPLGKLVGTMCAVSGVLVMSIPIPIIVSNFQAFYANQRFVEAAKNRKSRISKAKDLEYEERVDEHEDDCTGHYDRRVGGKDVKRMISSDYSL